MKRIAVDLDGVLCRFEEAACNLLGIDLEDSVIRNRLKTEKIDQLVGKAAMWAAINREGYNFWANLRPYDWTRTFYTGLQQSVDGHVYICTAPPSDPQGSAGKVYWTRKHLKLDSKNLVITPSKWLLASPEAFLIDDDERKVKSFREAGGHAFLFPNALRIMDGDVPYGTMLLELTKQIQDWLKV